MPQKKKSSSSSGNSSKQLSARTKKQIDSLPHHAQEIYKEAHANALQQYKDPSKRRGGKRQSAEEVAHKNSLGGCEEKI
jgi:cation transport regulator